MRLLPLGLAVLGAACSWSPPRDGGPPPGTLDISRIRDAVPRPESRSRYGNPESYQALGKRYYVMKDSHGYSARGGASWYGHKFHGQRTSSGEIYDMYGMTAAHRSLPIPCYVKVTNLTNGRSTIVRVNDRGPFHADRIIDLSYAAAAKIGILGKGSGKVEISVVDTTPAPRIAKKPVLQPEKSLPRVSGPLYLQLGTYSDRRHAENLRVRLRGRDLPAARIEAGADQTRFQVRMGPVSSRQEAERLQQKLRDYGIDQPRIVGLLD